MAAVLTTIYAEVVKTAAIRKFSRAPMCLRLHATCAIRGSCFRNLIRLGFCGSEPSLEELRGVSRRCRLQIVGFLTISTRIVVKTAAIRNRWYGAHAYQARFCAFARQILRLCAHAGKACPFVPAAAFKPKPWLGIPGNRKRPGANSWPQVLSGAGERT